MSNCRKNLWSYGSTNAGSSRSINNCGSVVQAPGAAGGSAGGCRARRLRGTACCSRDPLALARQPAVAHRWWSRERLHHPQRHLHQGRPGVTLQAGHVARPPPATTAAAAAAAGGGWGLCRGRGSPARGGVIFSDGGPAHSSHRCSQCRFSFRVATEECLMTSFETLRLS